VPPLFSAVSRRRCILSSPPVSDGQTTHYTSRRPLRAFPRERATQAALSAGADRRKALPRSSVRPSRFPWPRKSPRAWKCSRQCDDRAEGRRRECANDERTNERTRGETQLETRRGRTDELSIAPRLRAAETKSALMKLSPSRSRSLLSCPIVDSCASGDSPRARKNVLCYAFYSSLSFSPSLSLSLENLHSSKDSVSSVNRLAYV